MCFPGRENSVCQIGGEGRDGGGGRGEGERGPPNNCIFAKRFISVDVIKEMEILFRQPPRPTHLNLPSLVSRNWLLIRMLPRPCLQPSNPFLSFQEVNRTKQITALQQVMQGSWGPGGQLQEGCEMGGQCQECQISLLSWRKSQLPSRPPGSCRSPFPPSRPLGPQPPNVKATQL